MLLFYLLLNSSYAVQTNQLKMNKSVIYNLVLKKQNDRSPLLLLPPSHTLKSSLFFKNIYYSYSISQFLETFSLQSIYFTGSTFKNLLNNVVSSEKYKDPDFNEKTFYTSPDYNIFQNMVTFRLCNFIEISNQNNIGDMPALYTRSLIFRIYSCVFRYCENFHNGGAINSCNTPFLLVNDCDFTSCKSSGHGGAFYCTNSVLIVFRNAFQFCQAESVGGAFMYEDSSHASNLIIQSNLFSKCLAATYPYFYAKYYQQPNNTCYLYFNKFECKEPDNGTYYVIYNQRNERNKYSIFKNFYGDDNYNVHLSPSKTFSPTPSRSATAFFTESIIFTSSLSFSSSLQFTETSYFTQSDLFSLSQSFTSSLFFTVSSVFTSSQTLIPMPSRSIPCSQTPFPTLTRSPLNTQPPTPSISNTPHFTSSRSFTPDASPYATGTPALTKTPCITWPNLSLGLIILAGIILLLGIIANIYLIMLCCKPSEIFVQQVL